MYQLAFYFRVTTGSKVVESEYRSNEFRLRKNALHYLLEIVQSDYRADEQMVGGINCYKSEKTDNGDRKIIEVRIKVEKV